MFDCLARRIYHSSVATPLLITIPLSAAAPFCLVITQAAPAYLTSYAIIAFFLMVALGCMMTCYRIAWVIEEVRNEMINDLNEAAAYVRQVREKDQSPQAPSPLAVRVVGD